MKQNEQKLQVTEKTILGNGKNLYLVNWSYVANFGYDLIRADTEAEAMDKHFYSKSGKVSFIITKIDEKDMPCVFKGTNE